MSETVEIELLEIHVAHNTGVADVPSAKSKVTGNKEIGSRLLLLLRDSLAKTRLRQDDSTENDFQVNRDSGSIDSPRAYSVPWCAEP